MRETYLNHIPTTNAPAGPIIANVTTYRPSSQTTLGAASAGGRGRGVEQDVVAGHAHDALDALLAGLDGDGVGDAVADADAAAAAVALVDDKPLAVNEEGGHHGRAPAGPDTQAVRVDDVDEG